VPHDQCPSPGPDAWDVLLMPTMSASAVMPTQKPNRPNDPRDPQHPGEIGANCCMRVRACAGRFLIGRAIPMRLGRGGLHGARHEGVAAPAAKPIC
jgi:hypothetical protein